MTSVYADTSAIIAGTVINASDVKTPIDALDTALDEYARGVRKFTGFAYESESGADPTLDGWGSGFEMNIRRSNGTKALPTGVSGTFTVLGTYAVGGYEGSSMKSGTGELRGVTDGTWNSTSRPTRWEFFVTASATTSRARALAIKGDRYLVIDNAAAVPGTPTGGVHLWSESAELKVKDGAGNTTTLSPHNPQMLDPTGRLTDYVHREYNPFTGDEIELDIYGALAALEEYTRQQFIYVRDLDPALREDWDAVEAQHAAEAAENKRTYVKRQPPAFLAARLREKGRGRS